VDVIVHDATKGHPRGLIPSRSPGLRAWNVGSTRNRRGPLSKFAGYLQAGFGLHTSGFRHVRDSTYDLCIYTSIAAFSWGFPSRIRRRGIAKKLVLILWDFFPIHQLEIGRIRGRVLASPLKAIERLAIRRADVVAVMTPANARFLIGYHPGLKSETTIIPPWSSSGATSDLSTLEKLPRFTVVFGGQLVKGRGLHTLLDAASLLEGTNEPIDLLIAGDGTERARLQRDAERRSLTNVTFVGSLPRDEYRAMLTRAHVGVAVTVPGVTPPSFPSKIVEYCGLGLPVIVCVEPSSDAGDIVEQNHAGIKVLAGDASGVASAIRRLFREFEGGTLDGWADAAKLLYDTELSTERAVQRLETLIRS
jgi:glycosyltransferase involved in cell wall biosynthesis